MRDKLELLERRSRRVGAGRRRRRASRRSTPRASCRRASGSTCCSTKARSSSSTASSSTARPTSASSDQKYYGDGVVTGYGRIDGRLVYVFSQDFTVFGGSLSEAYAEKICKVMDLAMRNGAPVIGLNDSGGARIQEGVVSLGGYADIFLRNTLASGVDPADLGDPRPVRRRRGLLARDHRLHLHGARHVVHVRDRPERREDGDARRRDDGGARRRGHARRHVRRRALRARLASRRCLAAIRELFRYLPQNNLDDPPRGRGADPRDRARRGAARRRARQPEQAVRHARRHPARRRRRRVLRGAARLRAEHHRAASRTSARSASASSPTSRRCSPACSTSTRRSRRARFVRFCDAFNIPLVTFEDVPGFLPGVAQEHGGIIKHGAKLLYAYCEATVPKLTVITRKAYGGAYDVMISKHIRGDYNVAWPTAEIAVMGPKGAVEILFRKEITESADPQARDRREGRRVHAQKFANPYIAAARGYRRRHHRSARHAAATDRRARDAAHQARRESAEEARQHPAVTACSSKILIANRGEIALRVIRACRELGIASVAVYSDADARAPHVREADEAVHIGPPPSAESYLQGRPHHRRRAAHSAPRRFTPATASCPSASGSRARCATPASSFIGPPAEAIAAMGSKTAARQLAVDSGVPVVPGTTEPLRDADEARAIAEQFGYPVLLKAAAGGGGKGMRVVRERGEIGVGARRRAPRGEERLRRRRGLRREVHRRPAARRDPGARRPARQRCCRSASASARCSAGIRR